MLRAISGEASRACRVVPFRRTVASATWQSAIDGLRSSWSTTSNVAKPDTCFPKRLNLLFTNSRRSSVISTFRPRISIRMSYLLVGIEDRSYACRAPAASGGPLLLSNARNGPGHQGPARGGGAQIQGVPEARGGDQSIRAGDGSTLRRGAARGSRLA